VQKIAVCTARRHGVPMVVAGIVETERVGVYRVEVVEDHRDRSKAPPGTETPARAAASLFMALRLRRVVRAIKAVSIAAGAAVAVVPKAVAVVGQRPHVRAMPLPTAARRERGHAGIRMTVEQLLQTRVILLRPAHRSLHGFGEHLWMESQIRGDLLQACSYGKPQKIHLLHK
jgi:hypothetical protein